MKSTGLTNQYVCFALQINMEINMKSMDPQRAILKLLFKTKLTPSKIARVRGKSHNTIISLRDRARAKNLTLEKMHSLKDSELYKLLYPDSQDHGFIHPVWNDEIAYMEKGYNRTDAHLRYQDEVGIEYAVTYSTYCKKLKQYLGTLRKVFRHIHQPGYAMQIDFAGYTPYGLENGKKTKFQLFVAVLPASSLTSACIVRTQTIADHNSAIIHSIESFGGVPEIVVSDNLKAAVIKWNGRNGPIINPSFLGLGDYYGFFPKPTRVAKPKDKAAVENAVKYVQRLLGQVLRNQPLMELGSMQIVLKMIIEIINNRKMKRRGKTRNERFQILEKGYLMPLPKERKVFMDPPRFQNVKSDYHVPYDKSYYSVPHRLTGLDVSVRANANSIEIRYDGQVVAMHKRSYSEYDYITMDKHRHPNHALYNQMAFHSWAADLPENIRKIIEIVIGKSQEQRKRERIISKVRNLIRIYGRDRVETACELAILNQAPSFNHVTNLLENSLESQLVANDVGPGFKHQATKNIRGNEYFFPPKNKGDQQ